MASGLFSSIKSLSTKLLQAIRGSPSTSHHHDPPVSDQHKSVREDLEKLSRMLERIMVVQQDAEEREIHDRSIRLWLKELRGVAYEAEDVLDDFHYEVLRSIADSGDAAIEAYHKDGGTKRKHAEMHTSSSMASYSFSITKVVIPDGMPEKIKGITEKFQEISNARRDLHLREEDATRLVNSTQIRPPTSSHVDERAIFGREKEKENIISVLNPLNDPQFTVLPIIGMGGLGKTTLAQLVYNDSKFLQLFDKRAWVSVSENFDLVRLTRAIIESMSDNPCEFSELNKLQDVLKEKIRGIGLFLVLDDVWNENTELWEHFQVALKGGKTVKILTTTRNTSVAEIMQTTSPIQLDYLPNEICWSLFKHFAFDNGETSENGKLLEIGYDIVKKCRGSPLVTKVLGGILRYDMDEEKWREVLGSDISEIDESGKIFTPLQLSYQKLPLHLKPCFVYLAMFPKGERIGKDHVVRLWMAQGYINTNSSRTKKTLEEIGSEYLNELEGRSLIDSWNYNKCYLHDLIHDLARSISQRTNRPGLENDNLWNSSYKTSHLYLTKKDGLSGALASCNNEVIRTYVREFPGDYIDDSAIFSKITYVRALQLWNCMLPDTLSTMKHLRYLSIEDDKIESLPESLCLLYHLQTLDISCHILLELPENIKSLINLRFLRLCSGKIKQLPESISLLHNLDTLSLEHCSKLEKLPGSIEQLTNLHVLKLSEDFVCNLSFGIGKLTNLITLNGKFKVMGSDMTQGLGELRDMNRLSGLMSISGLKNIGDIENSRKANLVSKSNLRKLILNFEEDNVPWESSLKGQYGYPRFYIAISSSTNAKNENDEKIQEGVLESLQPHGNLTELVILNYGGRRVPRWFLDPSLMSQLTTVTLHFNRELTFLLPLLDQLPHLQSLKICMSDDPITNVRDLATRVCFSSPNLVERQAGYECPKLWKLTINKCPKLWKLTIPQKVEVLEVNACGCHEIQFSSQSELKRLSLSGCPNLLMLSAMPPKVEVLEVNACGCHEIQFSSQSELKRLSLSGCPNLLMLNLLMLSAMPPKVEVLEVNACGCHEIQFSSQSELKRLSLSGCPNLLMLSAMPPKVEVLEVNACGCHEIQFSSQSELKRLSLSGCPNLLMLSAMPPKVEVLEVNACGCHEIQFSSQSELKRLSLSGCPNLLMLSAIPPKVEMLEVNACGCHEIQFSSQSELKKLSISNCRELITLYYKSGDLPFLESISLSGCPNLMMLSAIPQELKQIDIKDCGFQEINFSSLSKLEEISIFDCRELVSVYYKIGDLPVLRSIMLSRCPNLLIFSAILEEMKQMHIKNCGNKKTVSSLGSENQNMSISYYREFIPPFLGRLGRVSLFNCPKLRVFSAIPAVELNTVEIFCCGVREIILPLRCERLEIHTCLELISVLWSDGDSSFLPKVKFVNCPQLKFLKIPKEVEELQINSCGTREIFCTSQSKVRSVDIYGCPELVLVHWMDGDVPFLKDLFFNCCPALGSISVLPNEIHHLGITECGLHEIRFPKQCKIASVDISGCPELISLQFLQGDLPSLEKFAIKSCPQFHEVLTIPYQLKELKIVNCCFPEIHLLPQSKLRRLIISECENLTAIKGFLAQFPTSRRGHPHPMMEMVEIDNCPRMDFGTQGNSYFYQVMQEASQDLGTEPRFSFEEDNTMDVSPRVNDHESGGSHSQDSAHAATQ